MKEKESAALLGCIAIVLAMPLQAVLRGWVICVMWGWFIVPQFMVQPLSIPSAIGFALMVTFLTGKFDAEEKKDGRSLTERVTTLLLMSLGLPLFVLAMAYVVHLFM